MNKLLENLFIITSLILTGLFCALTFYEDKEIVWMMLPIAGLLSQIGGTWKKQVRRFAIPIMFAIVPIGFLGFNWLYLTVGIIAFCLAILPFTLIGDSVNDSWLNWLWIVLLGVFAAQVATPVAVVQGMRAYWLSCWVPMVTMIVFGMGSNIPGLNWFFKWKFCEFAFWAATAVPICLIIND